MPRTKNTAPSAELALQKPSQTADKTHEEQQADRSQAIDSSVSADLALLNELYKTASVGKHALECIINQIEDDAFKSLLLSHYQSYESLSGKLSQEMTRFKQTPKSAYDFKGAMLRGSIRAKMFFNDTPAHVADMLIKGNNMGITVINRKLNESRTDCGKASVALAEELLKTEQRQIDELKAYL